MIERIKQQFFTGENEKFDPNDHVDKFALIYLAIIFVFSILLKAMGVI
jgi:hypothetical protein